MATIEHLMRNLDKVNMKEVIQEAVTETTEEIKNYQQQQMFLKGERSDGEKIRRLDGKYEIYAPFTVSVKRLKNQPTDRVTLRDTMSFHRGITIKAEAGKVIIDSTDEKTGSLIDRYGEDIFGLNKEYAAIYATNDMGPKATDNIISQIHK